MKIHKQIRINGVVQGVGFRPFIHKIALSNDLKGWILNDSQGVLIEVQGNKKQYDTFKIQLKSETPAMAEITHIEELEINSEELFLSFEIKSSLTNLDNITIVPSDADVCADCLGELFNINDRRYLYPFINCTNCGPRFSIIRDMPYDRKQTTMSNFTMCLSCNEEYTEVTNRRYHAQPNACPECGPQIWLCDENGNKLETQKPIKDSCTLLANGAIVAIKSIGGYHLAVSALNSGAINTLRKKKSRDNKPFAIMVRDIETVKKYCIVNEEEEKYLLSTKRPIVILKKKINCPLPNAIAPSNSSLGIMLPSAPLHHILLNDERLPALIMTSANSSGKPIVFQNDKVFGELNGIVDAYLMHNREIYTRVDDSLLRVVKTRCGENIVSLIRRSRGFAPAPIIVNKELRPVIASGAELKTTLALSKHNNVYLSQHIGDLKKDSVFVAHTQCAEKLSALLEIAPLAWAVDLHPHFRSTRLIQESAEIPVIKIQHHHAHMASCMGENNLEGETIGIIFDGTGYGTDGTIWGGEFLVGNYREFTRAAMIHSFKLLGGDKAVKEPYRVAVSLLYEAYGESANELNLPFLKDVKSDDIFVLLRMAARQINSISTTSMGRLFDGVSALLGVRSKIEYEAQASIELEGLLERSLEMIIPYNYSIIQKEELFVLDYLPMIKEIVNDVITQSLTNEHISRRFHSTIVIAACDMCEQLSLKYNTSQVVLSGGVFMNEFILANMYTELKERGLNVFVQQKVPSNDGGISLGQILVANAQLEL